MPCVGGSVMSNRECCGVWPLTPQPPLPLRERRGGEGIKPMTTLSLIVPVYNEAAQLSYNLQRILAAAGESGCTLELIAIDDGSQDASLVELYRAAAADPRIRPLAFTRNFGKEAAIQAGLTHAQGAAAVVIDADLQHPPELIPQMVQLWRQGLPIVEAVKTNRGAESWLKRRLAMGFYSLFDSLAGMDIRQHSDFKLLDRVVIDHYLALPERQRFFRGLIHWIGYTSARLPFEVAEQPERSSRWGSIRLLRYALNNLTSFSSLPLHLVTLLGMLSLLVGAVIAAVALYQRLLGQALDGFTTVILLLVMIGGTLMVGMGIIGHYVARLYDEVKRRPMYVLKPAPHPPTPSPSRGEGELTNLKT